jgi:hypothetical protein
MNPQFAHNPVLVELDGFVGNVESGGYLLGGHALGDEL